MVVTGVSLKQEFYPETKIGGFTDVDGTLIFYSHIAALLKTDFSVLEFGAGRGANVFETQSE